MRNNTKVDGYITPSHHDSIDENNTRFLERNTRTILEQLQCINLECKQTIHLNDWIRVASIHSKH